MIQTEELAGFVAQYSGATLEAYGGGKRDPRKVIHLPAMHVVGPEDLYEEREREETIGISYPDYPETGYEEPDINTVLRYERRRLPYRLGARALYLSPPIAPRELAQGVYSGCTITGPEPQSNGSKGRTSAALGAAIWHIVPDNASHRDARTTFGPWVPVPNRRR